MASVHKRRTLYRVIQSLHGPRSPGSRKPSACAQIATSRVTVYVDVVIWGYIRLLSTSLVADITVQVSVVFRRVSTQDRLSCLSLESADTLMSPPALAASTQLPRHHHHSDTCQLVPASHHITANTNLPDFGRTTHDLRPRSHRHRRAIHTVYLSPSVQLSPVDKSCPEASGALRELTTQPVAVCSCGDVLRLAQYLNILSRIQYPQEKSGRYLNAPFI